MVRWAALAVAVALATAAPAGAQEKQPTANGKGGAAASVGRQSPADGDRVASTPKETPRPSIRQPRPDGATGDDVHGVRRLVLVGAVLALVVVAVIVIATRAAPDASDSTHTSQGGGVNQGFASLPTPPAPSARATRSRLVPGHQRCSSS